jgi:phage/plasmid-associated DNA primase
MKNSVVKNSEDINFSSDDEDSDTQQNTINSEIQIRLQENSESILRAFKEFLSTPEFINSRGDATTNIIDIWCKKCYKIPDIRIPKVMKFLEIARRKSLKIMMNEKQLEYSGIMIDIDIKTALGGQSCINHTHYHRLCIAVIKILLRYTHFPENEMGKKKDIYVGFTKKPKLTYDTENNYYKDGIHMLIPGIQITREFKKLIIDTLIEEKTFDKVFREINPWESMTRSEFLDINSAHVPTFFIGSATKLNAPPYVLADVYKVQTTIGELDDIIPVKDTNFATNNTNICYEFSLNWAKDPKKGGIIEKIHYEIKPEYQNLLDQYKNKVKQETEFDGEDEQYYNDLSILNLHDPDMANIKLLLDILHQKRSEDYTMWFSVLCALAHTSPSYKTLGEYFSKKCPEKFDIVYFEKVWDSILIQKTNKISIQSIHYWAKLDNPDRYEEVQHRSIFNLLYKKIYDIDVEGTLEHYDIAEILYQVLQNKFVYDKAFGVPTWYEFILENEPLKLGELYKWREYNDRPNSLMKYISVVLPVLFRKVLARIKSSLDECTTELAKYHYIIMKNFQKSCRNLKNSGFKASAAKECEQVFEQRGFSDELDNDPNVKGVGNGVLLLGKKCSLTQGYHGYKVSKYTTANYSRMDPHNNTTMKVLIALRNLFPDDEPDTFDYIMHYLASTLDGNKKESIMMLLVGKGSNGKSFLVELHKGAIGSTYGVKMPLAFLTSRPKDAETATPALMQLKDAHFAYYSESNKHETLNMAKIKEFTGQETLSGRKLHSDYINFKPKCHHLVSSNNDFDILGTDHGTWRRIDYVTMKIKFCSLSTESYDAENPLERIADSSLGSHWAEDPKVLESYLGILVYYYESLHNNYEGKVRNVPHPHILKETEEFRNRQDRVNNFLNMTLVKCEDSDSEIPLSAIVEKYCRWYESQFPGATGDYKKHAMDQIENSKIQSFIKKTRMGNFLKGYRVLGVGETKTDDEEYYIDIFENTNKHALKIKKESALEYVNRLCADFNTTPIVKRIPPIVDKFDKVELDNKATILNNMDDIEYDSDIDDMIEDNKRREPTLNVTRSNNLISSKVTSLNKSNLDKNGFKTHTKKKCVESDIPVNELKKYANMGKNCSDSEMSSEKELSDFEESDIEESDIDN